MKNFFTAIFKIISQFSMAQENKVSKALKKYNNDTTEYIQKEILDFLPRRVSSELKTAQYK